MTDASSPSAGLAVIGGSHTGSIEQGWAHTPRGIGGRRRCLDSDSIFCGWAEFGVTQWHHVIVSHCHPALWNYGAQLCSSWNCHSSRYPFDILDPCPSLCLLFSFFRFLSFCFFVRVHFYSLQSSVIPLQMVKFGWGEFCRLFHTKKRTRSTDCFLKLA